MLWTHLGGGISAWGGRCNERLFPLVSLLSTYATARHRPPSWTTKLSARESHKKKIQIHTLKYENAVEKKHNVNPRLNKFKSADDDNASLSSSTSCSETHRSHLFWTFLLCFYRFKTLLFLNLHFLQTSFCFTHIFFISTLSFSGTFTAPIDYLTPEQMSVWWQLTQKPYFLYILSSVCRCGLVHHLPAITGKEGFMTNKRLQLLYL